MKTYIISRTAEGVKLFVKTEGRASETHPARGERFGFGFSTLGSKDHETLGREILRDWACRHSSSPAGIVAEFWEAFVAEFIAHRTVEEFMIDEIDIIRWHSAQLDGSAKSFLGS